VKRREAVEKTDANPKVGAVFLFINVVKRFPFWISGCAIRRLRPLCAHWEETLSRLSPITCALSFSSRRLLRSRIYFRCLSPSLTRKNVKITPAGTCECETGVKLQPPNTKGFLRCVESVGIL
jgi:hypothetical protein